MRLTNKQTEFCQAGFTLVEIMIAITVFAIGLLGVNIMQTSSIKGSSVANTLTSQTNLGVDAIEKIVNSSYTNIITNNIGYSSNNGAYTVTWVVSEASEKKTITFTVVNNTAMGMTQPYQIIYRKSKSM